MTDSSAGAMGNFTIREANHEDISVIAGFNVAMALETEGHGLDELTVEKGVAAVLDEPDLGFYLVAVINGEVAGTLLLTNEWSDWNNGPYWWIQSVYVSPEFRGKGIYGALYNEVVTRARLAGNVSAIRLYVEKDNQVAQSVYQRLGMKNSGYLVFESKIE